MEFSRIACAIVLERSRLCEVVGNGDSCVKEQVLEHTLFALSEEWTDRHIGTAVWYRVCCTCGMVLHLVLDQHDPVNLQ